jgi:hypothetical protein
MTRYRIGRAIVYDDDLEILKALIQNTLNSLIKVSTQVVAGYNNRNRRIGCSHLSILCPRLGFTEIIASLTPRVGILISPQIRLRRSPGLPIEV